LGLIVAIIFGVLELTSSQHSGAGPTTSVPPTPTIPSTSTPPPSSSSPPTDTSSSSPPPPSPPPLAIRHRGTPRLEPNPDYVDLDAPASDPQWGTLAPLQPTAQTDIAWVKGGLAFQSVTKFQVMPAPTWQKCHTATGYTSGGTGLEAPNITPGMTLCVITSAGRISIIKIVAMPDYGQSYLDVAITTYEPQVFPNLESN
jgi:hypothetical protein